MKILLAILLLAGSFPAGAQILKNPMKAIKNKAREEVSDAKYKARQNARESVRNELNGLKSDFDSTDLDYAVLLSDNSGLFGGRGQGEFGAKFLRLAGIARSLYQDADLSDEENAQLNLQMGQSGYAMGKFVFAEKRLKAAQSYFEKAGMKNDIGYIKTIAGQGLLYTTMGRFKQADVFTTEAKNLREEKFGATNMSMAATYNNFGVLHYNTGQYNESEKEFAQALAIITANNQQTAMPYALVLNNQAILFQSIGRYEAAEKNLKEAMQIASGGEISKARQPLKFYSNLALLYQQMGKYDQAEEIYRGLEKRLTKGKPEYANWQNNVAILLLIMNHHDRIEQLLSQAAETYKNSYGDKSPAYAKVQSDLGNFFRYKGRYAEAEPLLKNARDIRQEALGENHPLFVQSEEDLAILDWKKGDLSSAWQLYRVVMEKSLDFIDKYFPPMSEAEKTKYWDILSPRFQRFFNFALDGRNQDNQALTDLFTYRLATKGLLLNSTRKVSESIQASNNPDLIQDYNAWIDNKEQLTTLYGYTKDELKEQGMDIDSMEAATNAMEKKLSQASRDFARYYYTSKVSYEQVQQALKTDEALVEIIRLRNFDQTFTDSCRYVALIVTKENAKPGLVVMDNGIDMDGKLFKGYRRAMTAKQVDEKSYDYFWAKVDPSLASKKRIYVSLDGIYNQLNLNTLKKPGGDFLIRSYDIVLLSSGKDLVAAANSSAPARKAALIGFPEYGSPTIPELPGTKTEVDGINRLLKSSGYQVSEWVQKDATENNLKAAREVAVLHIATHGYFLQDVQRSIWPIGVQADYARDNVLLRSGLMLTGASDADRNASGLENNSNGVVTSYEAMNLDLKGTSLVVLSACETGLGEVKAGEGVYGLQRAFLVAGAKALIMSLWKVDDAATQQLMNAFYANWMKSGDMQKAFKEAQLQLMTKYKEPYYWGAFVMMQD